MTDHLKSSLKQDEEVQVVPPETNETGFPERIWLRLRMDGEVAHAWIKSPYMPEIETEYIRADLAVPQPVAGETGGLQVCRLIANLDWCIGYELTEANHRILDQAQELARKIVWENDNRANTRVRAPVVDDARLREAIADMKEARESHVQWTVHLRNSNHPDQGCDEWIEKYDNVLELLSLLDKEQR